MSNLNHYFEVVKRYDENPPDGIDYKGLCIACDTFEEATQTADENDADYICEIGGSWDEYKKCWFCGEWVSIDCLNKNDLCDHCENYLISRGEI
jgi:hypothetical protein